MDETKDVESAINAEQKDLDFTKLGLGTAQLGFKEDQYVKFSVKPKVSFGKLLKGKFGEAFGRTSLKLEFGKTLPDDDVEITVMVNGKVSSILSSPKSSDGFTTSFSATKNF